MDREQNEHQKGHNYINTTVIGVELWWGEESWSECMPWERGEFIGGGKIYYSLECELHKDKDFFFFFTHYVSALINICWMNQTGKRGQRRTFGTRGPGLNKQGGEDAPGTKTGLSSGRSSIASPWMISFAWTPCLTCFERFLSFHYVLCSSPSGGRLHGLFTHYPGPWAPTASFPVKSRSPLIFAAKALEGRA